MFLSLDEGVRGLLLAQLKMSGLIEEELLGLSWGQVGGAGEGK